MESCGKLIGFKFYAKGKGRKAGIKYIVCGEGADIKAVVLCVNCTEDMLNTVKVFTPAVKENPTPDLSESPD